MKKLIAKMKKVRMTPWKKLSTGEKVMKAVMKTVKIAVIVGLVCAALYAFVFLGILCLFLLCLGLGYPGDPYYRYR